MMTTTNLKTDLDASNSSRHVREEAQSKCELNALVVGQQEQNVALAAETETNPIGNPPRIDNRHTLSRTELLPRLQEAVALQQTSLQSLSGKKRLLDLQIDMERSKRQRHTLHLKSLKEHQYQLLKARKTHLQLLQKMNTSLGKCKERMRRLKSSSTRQKQDDKEEQELSTNTNTKVEQLKHGIGHLSKENTLLNNVVASTDNAQEGEPMTTKDQHEISVPIPSLHSHRQTLENFWLACDRNNTAAFLPCLNSAALIKSVMDLTALETLTLDIVQYPNTSTHHRIESLWNTCLDIFSDSGHEETISTDKAVLSLNANKRTRSKEQRNENIDPNLVLCPYELSGVCADVHCPYQHTKKRTGSVFSELILPRERIPLPSLKLPPPPMLLLKSAVTIPVNASFSPHLEEATRTQPCVSSLATNSTVPNPFRKNNAVEGTGKECLTEKATASVVDRENILGMDILESAANCGVFDWECNPDFVAVPAGASELDTQSNSDEDSSESSSKGATRQVNYWWMTDKDTIRMKLLDVKGNDKYSLLDLLYAWGGFQVSSSRNSAQPGKRKIDEVDNTVVEMFSVLASDHSQPTGNAMIPEAIAFVAKVVDCTRLSIHGGRFDVAEALQQVAQNAIGGLEDTNSRKNTENQSIVFILYRVAEFVKRATNVALNHNSEKRGIFSCCFDAQISLAGISEYLRLLHSQENRNLVDCPRELNLDEFMCALDQLNDPSFDCVEAPKKTDSSQDRKARMSALLRRIKNLLMNNDHSNQQRDVAYLTRQVEPPREEAADLECSSLKRMLSDTRIARSILSDFLLFEESGPICEKLLRPCLSEIRTCMRRSEQDGSNNGVGPLFRVTVLVGYLVLGVAQMVSKDATSSRELDRHRSATLLEIDGIVCQMLQQIRRETNHATLNVSSSLLELALAPLYALSASLSTCLGQYGKTQHRLELILCPSNIEATASENRRRNILMLSELLWSQLVLLRGTLPPLKSVEDTASMPLPALSSATLEEHNLISNRIASYGVHLHHISLCGDWNLVQALNNPQAGPDKSQSRDSCHALVSLLFSTDIDGRETEYGSPTDKKSQGVITLNDIPLQVQTADSESRSMVSAFPRSILLCGAWIRTLSLRRCRLRELPLTFGVYFEKLQELDLSQNNLCYLPKSIGKVKSLVHLDISSNCLSSLPDEVGNLVELKRLIGSNNQVAKLPLSIIKCAKLEVLDLRENLLQKVPTPKLPLKLTKLCSLLLDGNPMGGSKV